ncbi:ATP-binding protein, partial [Intestinimonas massiliensis]|uniref:sensor histidine kinase n=1 Tax=Intestinimonas massiliensis (ex Afouda et al. 2020) TaxID=1673721 RepID=UPI00210DD8B1
METKEITLTITREENGFVIHYADTGWGLVEKYKTHPERILEAFETSRATGDEEEEGTGMGMWIVNRTVSEYHGSLSLEANKR